MCLLFVILKSTKYDHYLLIITNKNGRKVFCKLDKNLKKKNNGFIKLIIENLNYIRLIKDFVYFMYFFKLLKHILITTSRVKTA